MGSIMGITKSVAFIGVIVGVLTIVLYGFLLSHAILGFSVAESPEDKKMMIMRAETIYIFENGTRIHMGPFEIPCHIDGATEGGLVVVPDYPIPSLSAEQLKDSDPQ